LPSIKEHPFFAAKIDWRRLLLRQV